MKAFKENIGVDLDSSLSDPFKILDDPFKKTADEFGAGEIEQHSENLTEEYIMELVRERINDIEVDIKNPAAAVEEIIGYLEEEYIEISKDVIICVEFAVSAKMNFLQNLERVEGKGTIDMALADAEWIGTMVEYIRENKNNPKKIEELWQQYDMSFLDFKEQLDKDILDKYNKRRSPEDVKRGILTEIAAMDLIEEIANNFEGCEKVEIKYSTPKDDVYKKIDFFLVVTFKNGRIVEIPVQVTSCNLSAPAKNPLDEKEKTGVEIKKEREELDGKIEFVLNNAIHTSKTIEDIEINSNYKYQKRVEDKMKKFFDENGNGIFMFVPCGKVPENKINSIKGEPAKKECIYKSGKPSRMIRDHFNKSPTIKSIETDLARIAQ